MSIEPQLTYKSYLACDQSLNALAGSGPVFQAEKIYSQYSHQPYVMGVPNATLALFACCLALEIRDAEVITTPYTWGGSLAGLLAMGNRPVFCDINPVDLTLEPDHISENITKKTKAILAVDIYGNPCDAFKLRTIADENGLWLIQDCAQSLGAEFAGKQSGWLADISVFSFSAGKSLDLGDGGMICTNNHEIYDRLIWLTQHPMRQIRDVPHFWPNEFALNMRISSLTARKFCQMFIKNMKSILQHRNRIRSIETELFDQLGIEKIIDNQRISSYYQWTIDSSKRSILRDIKNLITQMKIDIDYVTPSITRLLYDDPVFSSFRLSRPNRCKIAEKQVKNRVRLIFNDANKGQSHIYKEEK